MSGAAAGGDPSMEDILASIRRILDEDPPEPTPAKIDSAPAPTPAPSGPIAAHEPSTQSDELVLDASMLIETPRAATASAPEPPPRTRTMPMPSDPPPATSPGPEMPYPGLGLIGSAAADNAASSVSSLVRAVAGDRASAVHRDGPTIEDVVRDEIRPLLKDWLNLHLPPLVERLVRAEIERVISRAAP